MGEQASQWFARPICPGERGEYLDASALRRRYDAAVKRAGLRRLRFHDLRHVFGSLAIDRASIVQVQHWMGHADVKTTMRYLHHKSRAGDAALLAEAFTVAEPGSEAALEEAWRGDVPAVCQHRPSGRRPSAAVSR